MYNQNQMQYQMDDEQYTDQTMILEEELDENYEPTQVEVLEYAEYLGIDTQKEKKYLYIAREGLKAPLPSQWKPCKSSKGDVFYQNFETNERTFQHPCDEYYRSVYQEEKRKELNQKNQKPNQKKQNKFPDIQEDPYHPGFNNSNILNSSFNNSQTGQIYGQDSGLYQNKSNVSMVPDEIKEIEKQMYDQIINHEKNWSKQLQEKKTQNEINLQKQDKIEQKQLDQFILKLKDQIKQKELLSQKEYVKEKNKLRKKMKELQEELYDEEVQKIQSEYNQDKKDCEREEEIWLKDYVQKSEIEYEEKLKDMKKDFERKVRDKEQQQTKLDNNIKQKRAQLLQKIEEKKLQIQKDYKQQLENVRAEKNKAIEVQKEKIRNDKQKVIDQQQQKHDSQLKLLENEQEKIKNKIKNKAEQEFVDRTKKLEAQQQAELQIFKKQEQETMDEETNYHQETLRQNQIKDKEETIKQSKEILIFQNKTYLQEFEKKVESSYQFQKNELEDAKQQKLQCLKDQYRRDRGDNDLDDQIELLLEKNKHESNISFLINEIKELQLQKEKNSQEFSKITQQNLKLSSEHITQSQVLEKQQDLQQQQQHLKNQKKIIKDLEGLMQDRLIAKNKVIKTVQSATVGFNQANIPQVQTHSTYQANSGYGKGQGFQPRAAGGGGMQESNLNTQLILQEIQQIKKSLLQKQNIVKKPSKKYKHSDISDAESVISLDSEEPVENIRMKSIRGLEKNKKRKILNEILQERNNQTNMRFHLIEEKKKIQEKQINVQNMQRSLNSELQKIKLEKSTGQHLKKEIIRKLRGELNQTINIVNDQIHSYRELEKSYQVKNQALENIERLFNEYEQKKKRFNGEVLQELINLYHFIDIKSNVSAPGDMLKNNRSRTHSQDAYPFNTNTLQQRNQYEEEDSHLNNSADDSPQNLKNSKKPMLQVYSTISPMQTIQSLKEKYDNHINHDQKFFSRYSNQIESDLNLHRFKKKYQYPYLKVSGEFNDYSNWLKSMKFNLNRQLVDRSYPLNMKNFY